MKLRISLARHNGSRSLAMVEDGDGHNIELSDCVKPKTACLQAAKRLREAAARFELLAHETEPFHRKTHDRVNREKLTPNVEVRGGSDSDRPA